MPAQAWTGTRRAQAAYALLVAVASALYFAVASTWLDDLLYLAVGTSAGVLLALAGRSWRLVATGILLWAAADAGWTWYDLHGVVVGFPSFVDVLSLVGYVAFAAGAFHLTRGIDEWGSRERYLDAAIVVAGASSLVWLFDLSPVMDAHAGGTAKAVAIAYPLMDLLVLGALVRLLLARPPAAWARLLMLGAAAELVGDLGYGRAAVTGTYHGGWTDLAWLVAYGFAGLAALAPRASCRRQAPLPDAARIALLGLASLCGPGVLLVQSLRGRPVHVEAMGVVIAVTAVLVVVRMLELLRRRAASEQRFGALVRDVDAMVWECSYAPEGSVSYVYISPHAAELLGYPHEQLMTDGFWASIMHPADADGVRQRRRELRDGEPFEDEYRVLAADGRSFWLRVLGRRHGDRLRGVTVDVTEQKQARLDVEHSLSLLQATLESTADAICVADLEGRVTVHNQRFLDLWGLAESELSAAVPARVAALARQVRDPVHFVERIAEIYAEPEREDETLLELVDGRLVVRTTKPQRSGGEIVGRVWSFRDVTAERRAEEERRASQQRFQATLERMSLVAVGLDLDGTITFCNDSLVALSGYTREELVGRRWQEVLAAPDEEAQTRAREFLANLASGVELPTYHNRIALRSGEQRLIEWFDTALHDRDGAVVGAICIGDDVTERDRADAALRASESRFRALIEHATDLISIVDVDGRILYQSPSHERVLGWSAEELDLMTPAQLIHPDDRDATNAAWAAMLAEHGTPHAFEYRTAHRDGSWRSMRVTATNLVGAPGVDGIVVNSYDVTELLDSEHRLRHVQKLDAVGRLAGGIAHDFNNLLTAITGYSQFLISGLTDEPELRADAEEIARAADRAAALTRQLLTFSRRAVVHPKVFDLNELVHELEKLLVRLIGEHIDLETFPAAEPVLIRCDPGQIEQVIVNLVVNARDAMPAGGRLSIGTALVDGRVRLRVQDDGIGMDETTRSHLFEPFFTTKEQGKGTGLGLATVYGIVEQADGEISVDSAPGVGTRFDITFPLVEAPSEEEGDGLADFERRRGSETVLLVEDEPMVRNLARIVLARHGYRVLDVPGGAAALRLAAEHEGRIDLMVTDVVMPHMSGRELAEKLGELRPGVRVLYTSGYDESSIERHGLVRDDSFLPKPFAPDELARRVREVLDRPAFAS